MKRHQINPRHGWKEKVEELGFGFHSTDVPYWNESACYSFTLPEIEAIEDATTTLWDCCLEAVQYCIDNNLYQQLAIPEKAIPLIEASWENDAPAIYGRFDFCIKENQIKLLEFNADTPTSLYEAGIIQWFWLQDFDSSKDQFNSIHEKLIDYWAYLKNYLHANKPLHFSCVKNSLEDLTNTEYLRDCAMQAGLDTKFVFIDDIGWDFNQKQFVDMDSEGIHNIFKLYPWEWLFNEAFAEQFQHDSNNSFWIEPAWKLLLSNKAFLAILWQLFPNNPYLLPTYFSPDSLTEYAKKPFYSREGQGVSLFNKQIILEASAQVQTNNFVYQQLCTLPNMQNQYPVIGSWIIGQKPAGMGIRESSTLITGNTSCFVPHYIE